MKKALYDYARPQLVKEIEQFCETLKKDIITNMDGLLEEYELKDGVEMFCREMTRLRFEIDENYEREQSYEL